MPQQLIVLFVTLHALLLSWYVGLYPMAWLGMKPAASIFAALGGWLLWATLLGLKDGLLVASGVWLLQRGGWWYLLLLIPLWAWVPWLVEQTELGLPWFTPALLVFNPIYAVPEGLATIIGGLLLTVTGWLLVQYASRWISAITILLMMVTLGLAYWQLYMTPLQPLRLPDVRQANVLTYWPAPVRWVQGNLPIAHIRQTPKNPLTPAITAYETVINTQEGPPGTVWLLPEEGALPGIVPLNYPSAHQGFARLQTLATQRRWFIVLGCTTETNDGLYHNSVLVIRPDASPPGVSHKHRLTPFGETIPLGLGPWVQQQFHYTPILSPGPRHNQPITLTHDGHRLVLWPLICSDALYPDVWPTPLTTQTTDTEHLIVVLANLGWFQQHTNPWLNITWQTLLYQRSLSARWPMVVVGNHGPSFSVTFKPAQR
jgi:apolipoprotein N-acyltransferase